MVQAQPNPVKESTSTPVVKVCRPIIPGTPWVYEQTAIDVIKEMLSEGTALVLPALGQRIAGRRVLIKPNLVRPNLRLSFTTDLRLIEALIEFLKDLGARNVVIGENSTCDTATETTFALLGFGELKKKYGIELCPFDAEESIRVQHPAAVLLKEFHLPRTVLDVDTIVNVPKMKTHGQTLVSLALKNHHGFCVKRERLLFHTAALDQKLVDIYAYLKSKEVLQVIDGLWAIEGQGPCDQGEQLKDFNTLFIGADAVAVDAAACMVMGIDPREVPTIRIASAQGLSTSDLGNPSLQTIGEGGVLGRPFKRPVGGVSGLYPGIKIIELGVCKGCQTHAQVALDIMKDEKELDLLPPSMVLVLGRPQPQVPLPLSAEDENWFFGDCALELAYDLATRKSIGHCIPGCPPWLSDLRSALKNTYHL